METLTAIYDLAKYTGVIDTFFSLYGTYIWTAGLVIALLNCFFGYKLRKLWGVLAGFLLGAAAGAGLAVHLNHLGYTTLFFALAFGLFFAVLAFLLYRLGLFFLCTGSIVFLLWHFLPFHSKASLILYLCMGILTGILTLLKERLVVSLTTAVGGAWACVWFFSLLTGHTQLILLILITVILAILGILFQLKPWKEREEWETLEAEERQKEKARRHRRAQKKKSRKKAARQKRAQKRRSKNKKKPEPAKSHQKTQKPSPAPQASPSDAPEQAQMPSDTVDSSVPPLQTEAPSPENPSENPSDLSEIRKQLSENISEIYQEQLNNNT